MPGFNTPSFIAQGFGFRGKGFAVNSALRSNLMGMLDYTPVKGLGATDIQRFGLRGLRLPIKDKINEISVPIFSSFS